MSELSLRDTGLAVLVALIWGMGFVVAKGAMAHFPPILLMALRFSITALALVWFAGPIGANFVRLGFTSVVGASLQYALTFTGVKGLGAGLSALVVQLEVPFLIILGAVLLGERPSVRKWLGTLVAFSGVAIIASQERFTGAILPVFLVISGAFLWALGQVLVRGFVGMTGLSITAWTAVLAAPQLFVLSALFETGQLGALQTAGMQVWGAALYLGLVMTALGYFLWNSLLLRHEVGRVAPFLLLLPVFSVIGGYFFLDEVLTLTRLIGGAVVLSGVALITLTNRQRSEAVI
ncbi:DMT family transporter [Pseudorhodobacter sp.]|uniref:DMT family transporter n=1 Tax=Pseudorhodobacter sp. TaxID=1934400 RepID=UPI00264964F0|nr:EamA family transporter [Pseudorhodobacter sp.]MDN5786534.1 EamA family transporter [Pseudorhodobacter sp.]